MYSRTRLILTPREHAEVSVLSGVRIKRALRKTSRTRFSDIKTKADIFYGKKRFVTVTGTNCNCNKFKLKKPLFALL